VVGPALKPAAGDGGGQVTLTRLDRGRILQLRAAIPILSMLIIAVRYAGAETPAALALLGATGALIVYAFRAWRRDGRVAWKVAGRELVVGEHRLERDRVLEWVVLDARAARLWTRETAWTVRAATTDELALFTKAAEGCFGAPTELVRRGTPRQIAASFAVAAGGAALLGGAIALRCGPQVVFAPLAGMAVVLAPGGVVAFILGVSFAGALSQRTARVKSGGNRPRLRGRRRRRRSTIRGPRGRARTRLGADARQSR
jgi:hypothetical protein